MSEVYTSRDLGNALLRFDFNTIANIIKLGKFDAVGGFFLALNIVAVGIAAAIQSTQASFSIFFPAFDGSIAFGLAFAIGLIFQFAVIVIYSFWQSFFLELFKTNISINRVMVMIGYAGLWFIPAALLVNFNIIISLVFAFLSFHSLVKLTKEYAESSYMDAFFGIGIASIITGLFSIAISLLLVTIFG